MTYEIPIELKRLADEAMRAQEKGLYERLLVACKGNEKVARLFTDAIIKSNDGAIEKAWDNIYGQRS